MVHYLKKIFLSHADVMMIQFCLCLIKTLRDYITKTIWMSGLWEVKIKGKAKLTIDFIIGGDYLLWLAININAKIADMAEIHLIHYMHII